MNYGSKNRSKKMIKNPPSKVMQLLKPFLRKKITHPTSFTTRASISRKNVISMHNPSSKSNIPFSFTPGVSPKMTKPYFLTDSATKRTPKIPRFSYNDAAYSKNAFFNLKIVF